MVMLRVFGLLAVVALITCSAVAQESLSPGDARLEVRLDPVPSAPFEGQMVLGTIRGEYRLGITLEELRIPRMSSVDWVQLSRDEWTEEIIDGLPTRVMERRVAFYPRRPGRVTVEPIEHELTVYTRDGGRVSHVVRSTPVTIQARAAPETADGQRWLPVSEIEYSDTWSRDPSALPMGETVTRTVVLRALEATAEMLPTRPDLSEPWLISFAAPEQRTTEVTPLGPLTTVTWQWSLRPKTGERGVLPEVQIPYYDTKEDHFANIVLSATPIGYASAAGQGPTPWRSGFARHWVVALGVGVGCALPIAAAVRGGRFAGAAERADAARRRRARRALTAMRGAARTGDAAALRRWALALAAECDPPLSDRVRQLIVPLDKALFDEASELPELQPIVRSARHLVARGPHHLRLRKPTAPLAP